MLKAIEYIKLLLTLRHKKASLKPEDSSNLRTHKYRNQSFTYEEKARYMASSEWKTMQKVWLHSAGYRCQMFPFIVLGQHAAKKGGWRKYKYYGKYAIHHINKQAYENLGREDLNKDVIVLSKFAHDWVFHFLLSFGKRSVAEQKSFPNILQLAGNAWCLLALPVQLSIYLISLALLIFLIL